MAGRFSVETVFKAIDRVTAPVKRMQTSVGRFSRNSARSLRSVNKTIDSVTSSLKRGTSAAVTFGTIGVGAITTSIGLLVREFSKVEDAQAAFTPLLGGAKKAKEAVDAINETAASTPFQFETLANSVNQLLPVMNGDINNTVKTLRMLGDTAGGNAQKLDSITRGFTKAMLKGKVDLESLNMIAEAGVPIFGDLADVMGVKVDAAFFKMISAGKISTTQLTQAFEKMTNKGGIFFKGMEIASKTTSGMFSTLKDNISLTAAELGGVLAPTIKDMITRATAMAKSTREWVKGNRELISKRFIQFIESAKRGFNNLRDAISFIGEHGATIMKIVASVIAFKVAVVAAGVALTAFNIVVGAFNLIVGVAGVAMSAFTLLVTALPKALAAARIAVLAFSLALSLNPIGVIVTGIGLLIAAGALLVTAWDPVKEFFVGLWADITSGIDSVVTKAQAVGKFFGFEFGDSSAPEVAGGTPTIGGMADNVVDIKTGSPAPEVAGGTPTIGGMSDINTGSPAPEVAGGTPTIGGTGDNVLDIKTGSPVQSGDSAPSPQVVSPQARTAKTIEESRSTTTNELLIKDETGRAELPSVGNLSNIQLMQTGGF